MDALSTSRPPIAGRPLVIADSSSGGTGVGIVPLALDALAAAHHATQAAGSPRARLYIPTLPRNSSPSAFSPAASVDGAGLDRELSLRGDLEPRARRGSRPSIVTGRTVFPFPTDRELHEPRLIPNLVSEYYAEKTTTPLTPYYQAESELTLPPPPAIHICTRIAAFLGIVRIPPPPIIDLEEVWLSKVLPNLAMASFSISSESYITTFLREKHHLPQETELRRFVMNVPVGAGAGAGEPLRYYLYKLPNRAMVLSESAPFAFGGYKRLYKSWYIHPTGRVTPTVVAIGIDVVKEARLLLDHPDLIHVHLVSKPFATFFCDGAEIAIWEYCENGDFQNFLDNLSRKGKATVVDLESVFTIIMDVLASLSHLHTHGYLHLDVKPSNIFLRKSKLAVLGDLGLVMNRFHASSRRRDVVTQIEKSFSNASEAPHPLFDFERGVILYKPLADYMTTSHVYPNPVDWHNHIRDALSDGRYGPEFGEENPLFLETRRFLSEMQRALCGIPVIGTGRYVPEATRRERIVDELNDVYAVGEMLRMIMDMKPFKELAISLSEPIKRSISELIEELMAPASLSHRSAPSTGRERVSITENAQLKIDLILTHLRVPSVV